MYKKRNFLLLTIIVSLLVAVTAYTLLVSVYGCPPCPEGVLCEPCPRSPSMVMLFSYVAVILLSMLTFIWASITFLIRFINKIKLKNHQR